MPQATIGRPFPEHFDGKRFYNPDAPQARGWLDFFRWKLTSRPEPSPAFVADVEPSIPPRRVEGNTLRVTFVNHSTVLLQQTSSNILTDPIWSLRASPFSWIGPRRRRNPGVQIEDLPPISIVLISHNHYDHLDLPTLRLLTRRRRSVFITPTGVGRLLRSENITPVHELDWGDSQTVDRTVIHCVPAMHFSSRGVFDRNKTLWCGYIIESPHGIIYFAGDTGFGSHFSQIHTRFGPPRLSLLPIGADLPRWFMAPIHMAPEDALEAHRILESRTSIAIHHGTFQLGDDSIDSPARQLLAAGGPDSFLLLQNGQSAAIS
jgi:L-ascorbate metabolism protein UlaG (beta-lactamase superfamily)